MTFTELVPLSRDCEVVRIPSGVSGRLSAGTRVRVKQSLGSSYTVAGEHGELYRVDARDAEALGLSPAATEETSRAGGFREELVLEQLKTIFDPEIPVNIVDLGLIRSAEVTSGSDGRRIEIKMTMTAPGCGMAGVLKADVEGRLLRLPEVKEVSVEVVLDPPWNPGMMSEAAKLQLGFDLDYGTPSTDGAFKIIR